MKQCDKSRSCGKESRGVKTCFFWLSITERADRGFAVLVAGGNWGRFVCLSLLFAFVLSIAVLYCCFCLFAFVSLIVVCMCCTALCCCCFVGWESALKEVEDAWRCCKLS